MAVREQVQLLYLEKWKEKVKDLVLQGDFLNLLISEQTNVCWQSVIYGVPKGVMEFAMRASTNKLATLDNLKRWKITSNDNCHMCSKPNCRPKKCTLFHILNHCEHFLGESERFVWRHNSILNYIILTLKENKPEHIQIYADLEGHNINGHTIPQNIVVTSSRPDLVIIDSSTPQPTVYLFELTVCFERFENINRANSYKYDRYTALAQDIKDAGFDCKNLPFEVGSRGHLTTSNKSKFAILHSLCKPQTKFSQFWKNTCKTSLLCSYAIYLSRNDSWTSPPYLKPVK